VPTLDREGSAYTSFQGSLVTRITRLRDGLVLRSGAPQAEEWFDDFRTLVSDSVAFIENTLHQVYFKAKYDPLPGWRFDPNVLGLRHGRRVADKLKWIQQITGVSLHARDEVAAFVLIKDIRNHLQHFDPPSFACTWEEMAEWLNAVLQVGRLAWMMRKCVGALPSVPLIEFLLQRRVAFTPRDPTRRRLKRPEHVGYASTSEATLEKGLRTPLPCEAVVMQAPRSARLLPADEVVTQRG